MVATNQHQMTIRHQRCKYKAPAATRNGRQMTVCFPERRASTVNGQQMTTVTCVHDSQIVIGTPSRSRMAAEGCCLRPKAVLPAEHLDTTHWRRAADQPVVIRVGHLEILSSYSETDGRISVSLRITPSNYLRCRVRVIERELY